MSENTIKVGDRVRVMDTPEREGWHKRAKMLDVALVGTVVELGHRLKFTHTATTVEGQQVDGCRVEFDKPVPNYDDSIQPLLKDFWFEPCELVEHGTYEDIACKRLLVNLDGFHIDTIRCMLVMASNKGSHGFQIAMQDPKDPSFVHIVTYKPPADGEPGEIEWHAESMRSWAEEPHQTCHISQLLMAGINKYLGRK